MIYYLFDYLNNLNVPGAGLFNYISFRTGAAILTSLFFSLIFGEFIIKSLSSFQPIGQPIRTDGPPKHILEKSGTPTMGGLLIISSIAISTLLWCNLFNIYIWICLFFQLFLF